jgi:hypothetical protein
MKNRVTGRTIGQLVVRVGKQSVGAVGVAFVLSVEAVYGEGRAHIEVQRFNPPLAFTVNTFEAATTYQMVGGWSSGEFGWRY